MSNKVDTFVNKIKSEIAGRVAGRKDSKFSKYYEEINALLKKRIKNKAGGYNALTVLDIAKYLNEEYKIDFKIVPEDKVLKNGKPHPYAGKYDVSSLSVLTRKLKTQIKETELEFID